MTLSTGYPSQGGIGPARPGGIALPILCVPLLLAGCGGTGGEEASGPAATVVETAPSVLDTISVRVRAVGTLEADARTEIRPEIDGYVTEILYEEGAEVQAGEVLVRLDRGKLRSELEAARATAARLRAEARNLERRVERNDSLLAQGAISQQAFDDLVTEYEAATARLEEAEANAELARERLEDATIRAPFGGLAGARDFDLGEYVSAGDRMFTLVDDDPMEIRFTVPERYLGQLRVGKEVTLRLQSSPDREFTGRVDYVSPYVDPTNRTVELKARVPNPASELRDGQFANVLLELEEREALMVPEAAILPSQQGSRVFVVRGDTARRVEVRTGARQEGRVEVLSAFAPDDTVIVAGHQRLTDGALVEPRMTVPATLPGEPAPGGGAPSEAGAGGEARGGSGSAGPGSAGAGRTRAASAAADAD